MRNTWSPKVVVHDEKLNQDQLVDEIKDLVYECIANFEKSKSENPESSGSNQSMTAKSCTQLRKTGSDG